MMLILLNVVRYWLHKFSEILVNKLLEFEIISVDKKDNYLYGIEMLIMKIFGFVVVGIIAIIDKMYIETTVFYITFKTLRAYTNGYHSKYYWVCLIESAVVYIFICFVAAPFVMKYLYESYFITGIAMIFIFIIAPVNSESIMFNEKEIKKHKEKTKYILTIDGIVLFMSINFNLYSNIVAFFELAIILDAILLVIAKMLILIQYFKINSSN